MRKIHWLITSIFIPGLALAAPDPLPDKMVQEISQNAVQQCDLLIHTDAGLRIDAMRFAAGTEVVCGCVGKHMAQSVGAQADYYTAYQKDAPRFTGDLNTILRQTIASCGANPAS